MSDDFDFSEVVEFARDLGEVPRSVIPNARKAVEFAARATDDAWTDAAKGPSGKHARRYPTAIDYDLELNTDGVIAAEVGPSLGRAQGSLGFLDEGGEGVRAAPQRAGRKAAKVADKELEIGLTKAVGEGLG